MELSDRRKAWAQEGRRLQRIADGERAMARSNIGLAPLVAGTVRHAEDTAKCGWLGNLRRFFILDYDGEY